jgi:hypothetical protein
MTTGQGGSEKVWSGLEGKVVLVTEAGGGIEAVTAFDREEFAAPAAKMAIARGIK